MSLYNFSRITRIGYLIPDGDPSGQSQMYILPLFNSYLSETLSSQDQCVHDIRSLTNSFLVFRNFLRLSTETMAVGVIHM
jgi:hypothetical protein